MEYHNLVVPILLLATFAVGLPVNNKEDVKEQTIAVYIPYDVKYVPVEVPDKFVNIESSNPKSPVALEPIVLRQGDVLNYLQTKTGQGSAIKPVSTDEVTKKTDGESSLNDDNLVVIPVSTLTEALKKTPSPSENEDKTKEETADAESAPSKVENGNPSGNHRLSKRQAPRFPFYRPVLRFSRIRGSRTRLGGPSRNGALVGYMSDRDFFPTVA